MPEGVYLSVILPAYNEAGRISSTLIDIDAYLHQVSYEYEILVVNDGSKDNTAEVVGNFVGKIKNLRLIDNKANQGKGGVVRDGMLAATGAVRLFMDADNATAIDQFDQMRAFFEEGYDVVIGSRAVKGAVMNPPEVWYRQVVGRVGNWIIQLTNVWGISDTQCGFKAFTASAAEKIFPKVRTNGWAFDVEVLALARAFGYRIKEVPVYWVDKAGSKIRLTSYLKFFIQDFKIRWWFWTNVYGLRR